MPAQRQQRTLSRRRFDPGQGPLPVLIPLPAAAFLSSTFLKLVFPVPVVVRGIPPILKPGDILPSVCTIVDDQTIELEYLGGTQPGEVYTLPEWTPTIRGLNGEWITPGEILVGGGVGGGMPLVAIVNSVTSLGGNDAEWLLSEPLSDFGAGALRIAGVQANSYTVGGPGQIIATYPGPVNSGDGWRVEVWDPAAYDRGLDTWIAPGLGVVQ